LRNWAYHQQTLIQQQSAIDPKSRTRLVTCQYVGSILECTTS